jgi:hypothetical protein
VSRTRLSFVVRFLLSLSVALGALTVVLVSRPRVASGVAVNAMPLAEFASDGANGRLWNAYDRTASAVGPTVVGRPSPVLFGGTQQVFARSATGDLVQFAQDGANGRAWNAYDLTEASGGPGIGTDPSAVVTAGGGLTALATTASGDLEEFTNDNLGGRLWNALDISKQTNVAVVGDVSVVATASGLAVFAQAVGGDLVEFIGAGTGGRSWTTVDLTQGSGGPTISGSPNAVLYGASTHVYAVSAGAHLFEFDNDGLWGRLWNAYDLTSASGGPDVSGQPSPVVYGATVHVDVNASGQLFEFDNDGAGGRLWNAYDLTSITHGPTISGSPSAVRFVGPYVEVYARGPGGDMENYVNDGAGGRLWNPYDLTQATGGPVLGGDPAGLVVGSSLAVFASGPPPPAVVQAVVAAAEGQDQNGLAVTETPPGSNCNPYSAYWGRGSASGCTVGTLSEEWCSDFAQWVWAAAGIDTSGINGWAFTFVGWGQQHTGAWEPGATNNPQPGDAVVWGDMASSYAIHVGIVVGVSQGQIDVVSGNSGPPIDAAGDVDAVWDSGYFDPSTSSIGGYPIIGYVSPTGWTGFAANAQPERAPSGALAELIATQDDGK